MSIFLVCRIARPELAEAAIRQAFPDAYPIGGNDWLISCEEKTARAVSDSIGFTGEGKTLGNAIVFQVGNYWGRAPQEVWEWLKTRIEATNG